MPKIQQNSIGARIRYARESARLGQQELADKLEYSKRQFIKFEKNEIRPKAAILNKVAQICNVTESWLLTGQDSESGDFLTAPLTSHQENKSPLKGESGGDYIGVPMSSGEISAGGGLEADNRFDFKLFFHKEWLAKKGDPANMSMIRVSGNSMEPTVQHGDVALINHAISHIDTPGAIYAISVDGQVSLKRLQAISKTGQIKVISDNKDYDVDYVEPGKVTINGKALWVGRELR